MRAAAGLLLGLCAAVALGADSTNPYYVENPVYPNRTTFLVYADFVAFYCSSVYNPDDSTWCWGGTELYRDTLKYDHLVILPTADTMAWTMSLPGYFEDPESVTVLWLVIYTPALPVLTPLLQAGVAVVLVSASDNTEVTTSQFMVPDPEPWWPSKWGDFPRLYKLFTDDYQGAYEVAREFCRLTNAEDRIHEILIAVADTSRATGFADGVAALCGDRGHTIITHYFDIYATGQGLTYEGIYNDMASYFTAYPGISVVVTLDEMALSAAYDAAADFRSGGNTEVILGPVAYRKDTFDYAEFPNIFAVTNSQLVDENRGVHFTTQRLLDIIAAGEAVELSLQKRMMETAIQIEVFDMGAYIVRQLLPVYAKETAPQSPVEITISLRRVRITEVTPSAASFFEITAIIDIEWMEPRLAWDPYLFNETLTYTADQIWTPSIYIDNNYFTRELTELPVQIDSNGRASMKQQVRSSLLCDSDLIMLPFDVHNCELTFESTRRAEFEIMSSGEFLIADNDDNYELEYKARDFYVRGGFMDEEHTLVRFKFKFSHRPFGHYIRLIFPAVLLNMAGFLAFWVDGATDSLQLGITTLLCTLALRQTIDFPDTTYPTWLEGFMFINILFQFVCVVLSVSEYNEQRQDLLQQYIVKRIHGYHKLAKDYGGALTPTFMKTPRDGVHKAAGAPPAPEGLPALGGPRFRVSRRAPARVAPFGAPAAAEMKLDTSALCTLDDDIAPPVPARGLGGVAAAAVTANDLRGHFLHAKHAGHGHGAGHHDHGPHHGPAGRRASIRESVKKFNPFASLQRLQNPQKYGEETTPAADLIGRWIICPIYFIVMMVYCVDRGSGVKPWFPERTGDE